MTKETEKITLIGQLLERRVPQILGIYLGTSWGILQFVQYIVGRFNLSRQLEDVSLVILLSLIPSVCVVVWSHGKGDWGNWSKLELFGIPLNLVFTGLLLFLVLGADSQVVAGTNKVVVQDDEGRNLERLVAGNEHRKRLALFPLENKSGDADLDWLRFGVPISIYYDLTQDPFLSGFQALSEGALSRRLLEANWEWNQNVPLPLSLKLAAELHLAYLVRGSYTVDDQGWHITTQILETKTGQEVAVVTHMGKDLFALVDEITLFLKTSLDVPTEGEGLIDMPLAEIFTDKEEALRAMVDGFVDLILRDRLEEGLATLKTMVEHDPNMAIGWYIQAQILATINEGEKSLESLAMAEKLSYRMPELTRYDMKGWAYMQRGEPERFLSVLKITAELFPEDVNTLLTLAGSLSAGNRHEEALACYEKVLEVAPEPQAYFHTIGRLHRIMGDREKALEYYQRYADLFPKQALSFSRLGDFYIRDGDFETAHTYYEKAMILEDIPRHRLALAENDIGRLRFKQALAQFEKQLAGADDPMLLHYVLVKIRDFYQIRGQIEKVHEYQAKALAAYEKFATPLTIMFFIVNNVELYGYGRKQEGIQLLKELERTTMPPYDRVIPFGYVLLHMRSGDHEQAETLLKSMEGSFETMRFAYPGVARLELVAWGQTYELKGDYEKALTYYRKFEEADQDARNVQLFMGRCLRKLDKLAEAEQQLKKALARMPYEGEVHYELALVYRDTNRKALALEHLRRAASIWEEADADYEPAANVRKALTELEAGNRG
ncbi:MAG: tetratricopeptide repeat protein [Acidobacteriota bacterium]|nr:tetratricopeptide repeat protein [Acidobacteriota bacterium]